MNARTRLLTITAILCSVIGAFQAPLAHAETAVVGSPAPDFTAKDTTNSDIALHNLKGKIVVLEWFNPNCPFVKKFYEHGDMQRFQASAKERRVVWLTVSSSASGKSGFLTQETGAEVRKTLGMNSHALLMDSEGTIGKLYGARTTPHVFVIDPQGKLAYDGAIDSIRSTDHEDIAGATNYVNGAIDALATGKAVEPASTEPYGCSVKY